MRKNKFADGGDVKDISFKESFRRARESGLSSFTFGGKKYTTELAKPSKAPDVPTRRGRLQSDDDSSSDASPAADRIPKEPRSGNGPVSPPKLDEETDTSRNVKNTLAALGGLGAAGALASRGYKAYKGIKAAADLANKAKKTEEVVAGNAANASRMKDIAASAEKAVAKKAADLANKAKKTEEVVAGNAANASRMKDIAASAEKAVAKKAAADKDAYSTATSKRLERGRGNVTVEKDSMGFYNKGGVVRGAGCVTKGVRKAKNY